ncbi:hypothetical protein V7S43_015923 [Phytophthora oleae]|uniref:Ig-like domain-containing protein n=1 Tax=Phytophthora oleae TaxID=2107226 RepID=A0ABD3EY84_9STRA
MSDMVDLTLFDLPPWQSWVIFGACFYAVRINALLVLGYSTVTLEELLPGMRLTEETRAKTVKLAPLRVFQCAETFHSSTPRLISSPENPLEKVNWTSNGYVAVDEASGDIFFALKNAFTYNVVVLSTSGNENSVNFSQVTQRIILTT